MENGGTAPIILRHFVATPLVDPTSGHVYSEIALKLGPIRGPYDIILGTPFLPHFRLSVSIASRSLNCEETGHKTLDHRLLHSKPVAVSAINTVVVVRCTNSTSGVSGDEVGGGGSNTNNMSTAPTD
ncbi:hypothetical protein MJO29_000802 [Puccinia striiformis f. sp. tritici]|nr:hypothetical protein MJO29_000802 [Puccinia striiformis f. sp. tritici]